MWDGSPIPDLVPRSPEVTSDLHLFFPRMDSSLYFLHSAALSTKGSQWEEEDPWLS